MSDGVNPGSIEEQREEGDEPAGSPASGSPPSMTGRTETPRQVELADPGAADQPAEGGLEQNDEADEDFGARPA